MAADIESTALAVTHYDADYFAWQNSLGDMTGVLNGQMFAPFVKPKDAVVDFGCGGGYLLSYLQVARKLGIDVNPVARDHAKTLGIDTVASLDDVADNSFDVAISCHALEHTEAPLDVLRIIKSKIKPGGRAVFVVPCERYDMAYVPTNIDQHLYTWSPVNIGNLFVHAGFEVETVQRIAHRWPPLIHTIYRFFGLAVTNFCCKLYAWLRPKLTQIRVVARRPIEA